MSEKSDKVVKSLEKKCSELRNIILKQQIEINNSLDKVTELSKDCCGGCKKEFTPFPTLKYNIGKEVLFSEEIFNVKEASYDFKEYQWRYNLNNEHSFSNGVPESELSEYINQDKRIKMVSPINEIDYGIFKDAHGVVSNNREFRVPVVEEITFGKVSIGGSEFIEQPDDKPVFTKGDVVKDVAGGVYLLGFKAENDKYLCDLPGECGVHRYRELKDLTKHTFTAADLNTTVKCPYGDRWHLKIKEISNNKFKVVGGKSKAAESFFYDDTVEFLSASSIHEAIKLVYLTTYKGEL